MNQFEMASQSQVASFLVEEAAYSGVKKIIQKVAKDIELVTNQLPDIKEKLYEDNSRVILVGTLGKSQWLETLENKGMMDFSMVRGKREVYQIAMIKQPFESIKEA